ncbi:nicotinate (nicotinamide) nucleotide adenylyltransferase [Nitrosophilus alvini]|uniref:nicotinate (nicotinamide) nucleotide adenylyltransferase n=1 Tax=Nitrosophilus alvini TaxID=2714855 RepID=UPI00190AA2B8|nr:nicotinate (nicotinamide) nucleotide adenylyltransferase [Nitrosophilus alvini]
MKIAIFGGSFDPVHTGHIEVVKKALHELDIDKIIIVPTYLNPFKKRFFAPPALRVRWLKKAFMPFKNVDISLYEIENQRPTYTIETTQYLKKKYKNIEKIYIIIGADNLKDLKKWYKYRHLNKIAEFVIATRGQEKIPAKYKKIKVNVPVSSTQLRKKPIRRYLPKIVAGEIIRFYKKASGHRHSNDQ